MKDGQDMLALPEMYRGKYAWSRPADSHGVYLRFWGRTYMGPQCQQPVAFEMM